jgi:hypothetical protein
LQSYRRRQADGSASTVAPPDKTAGEAIEAGKGDTASTGKPASTVTGRRETADEGTYGNEGGLASETGAS